MKFKAVVVMMLAVLGLKNAFANDLYLDQSGDSATITITQDGADNRIGEQLTPVLIYGDSVTTTITQQGSNNELDMVVNGTAATVTLSTIGSTNVQEVNCGTSSTVGCSSATITTTIQGDNNNVIQNLGAGGGQRSVITLDGDYTNITHTATDAAHKADITVDSLALSATQNNITVTQSGATVQQATINAAGAGININVTQSP